MLRRRPGGGGANQDVMDERTQSLLAKHRSILCCPRCGGELAAAGESIACTGCEAPFPVEHGIPLLFAPNEWNAESKDVTDEVRAFYEETPFPNYDDFDSIASLTRKAREGLFARVLDEQVPPGVRVIECGCGTGQLSNFLGVANRTVFGTDLCLNSLKLGEEFREKNGIDGVRFLQMNLFRPAFKPQSFDLVISNGVLHHTSDPKRACASIARLVRPGGYLLVGLYHRYGRLITDLRRLLFRLSGDRFRFLDPNLRRDRASRAKQNAWFADQYKHPHESKHTIGEVLRWLDEIDFRFVKCIPISKPFRSFAPDEKLFVPDEPGNALERLLVELGMITTGSREGGFFIVIGQRAPAL
jgi:SAM-dependent methyltransferase